jgi:hypothetical protein
MSSADYIANNERVSMGGYEEGLQNMYVAKILRDPSEPISKVISSLHFFGISFGGHGVLFSSLLNDLNEKPIQSFTAMCPVVNLRDTFNSLARPNILGVGADFWSSLRLVGLKKKDPLIEEYGWTDIFKLKPVFLPRVINYMTQQYEKNPPPIIGLKLPVYSQKSLWDANNFWGTYKNVKSPTLVLGTVSDAMVSPNDNLFWLKEKSRAWNSDLGVVVFEEGFHCTLPIAYDWASTTSLFNGRMAAYDDVKLMTRFMALKEMLSSEDIEAISKSHFAVGWANENREVLLKFPSFSVPIPLDQFDFKFTKIGEAEKTSLERWIYHNVQGQILNEGEKIKAQLHWPMVL